MIILNRFIQIAVLIINLRDQKESPLYFIKTRIITVIFFSLLTLLCSSSVFSLSVDSQSTIGSGDIFLGSNILSDCLDQYCIDDQVFKLSNSTTIDPEIQLALEVSFIIESESGKNLRSANGRSIGPLHIEKPAVDDVNRILGYQAFSYEDRMSFEKSCQIFRYYLNYYGQIYTKKTGHIATTEVYVRIWNGGPNGWKNSKTDNHWQKAKKVIF